MSKDLEFLIELVKGASHLINNKFEVKEKGENGDLVTNLDYKVEKYIIEKIKESYPSFSIVGEEYSSDKQLSDNCFTVDPIDGTINFAHNIPFWGIQVACIRDKKTCAAVIYLPKLDELYYADENGAFMNGKSIKVNKLDINKGLYVIEGPENLIKQVKMKEINVHCGDFHCSAVNFAWVACGRLSGTNFLVDTLWDYIPGQYIVSKAGGVFYNDTKMHIAANNQEFLDIIKDKSSVSENEKIVITKN